MAIIDRRRSDWGCGGIVGCIAVAAVLWGVAALTGGIIELMRGISLPQLVIAALSAALLASLGLWAWILRRGAKAKAEHLRNIELFEAQRRAALAEQTKAEEARLRAAAEAEEAERLRFAELSDRWGAEVATRIVKRDLWQGQTRDQLLEALGPPADWEEEVLKTKVKHVLKYYCTGPNRYALRIMLEDGVVVGWHRS